MLILPWKNMMNKLFEVVIVGRKQISEAINHMTYIQETVMTNN